MNEQATQAPTTSAEQKAAAAPAPKATKAPKAKAAAKKSAKPAKKAKAKKADADAVKGPGVLRNYAPDYHKDKENKTVGGHVSVDNNDKLAKELRGKDLDTVYKAAAKLLKEPEADLRKRYKHLNPGMQRMNLGNRMRAAA